MRPAWLNPLYEFTSISVGGFNTLSNIGSSYDSNSNSKGLGLAVVDFTNVANLDFTVFVNKVGSGTQSWQLWNVTDATQVAVIDDAGAAGDKTLSTTVQPGLTGQKTIRIRAKSTTALDDPVFYGAAIVLR